MSDHFRFKTDPQHGYVVSPPTTVTAHLAHWLLTCETFEPVPGTGMYRLTEPERDGPRRTRQTVHDLRSQGYAVQADPALDPGPPAPPRPRRSTDLMGRRSRIAEAAAGLSTQLGTARPVPPVPPSSAQPLPQRVSVSTARTTAPASGRTR
ncbi:hypothetical protein N1H47_30545 [Streptomyces noursei]|nr:hypothetical protein [Streptomyces noursei]UWS77383.1 hypothetical protein N1H47_30545 [Streptomyces noursei]